VMLQKVKEMVVVVVILALAYGLLVIVFCL
jgi:hypothetical protein